MPRAPRARISRRRTGPSALQEYGRPSILPKRCSNHSCDPNIGVQGQIIFVAMRDIQAGEELTHDWATTDDDTYAMVCHCGSPQCRKIITGQDWRRPELQEKYREYMSWYLQEKIKRAAQHGTGSRKVP